MAEYRVRIQDVPLMVLVSLGRLLVRCPYRIQVVIGKGLGGCLYFLLGRRRYIARRNIETCFPDYTQKSRNQLLKSYFYASGQSVMDMMLAHWGTEQRIKPIIETEGLQHFIDAQATGRGLVLMSAHFNAPDMGGRLITMLTDCDFAVYVRAHNQPYLEHITTRSRKRYADKIFFKHKKYDVLSLIRHLKSGGVLWYAADQDIKEHSIFVPFFGIKTATLTVLSRIVRKSQAIVLPFYCMRRPGSQGFVLKILPPLQDFGTGSTYDDAKAMNEIIETMARAYPEQYFWMHRRFKTRPPGEASIY